MAYTSSQVVQAVPTGINSALVLITSQSFSGSATVVVSNAFSATYKNYKVILNNVLSASGTPDFLLKFGSATTNYTWSLGNGSSTTFNDFSSGSNSTSTLKLGFLSNTENVQMSMEILGPFLTNRTFLFNNSISYQVNGFFSMVGMHTGADSFTSFTLSNSTSSNMSGTLELYGYAI